MTSYYLESYFPKISTNCTLIMPFFYKMPGLFFTFIADKCDLIFGAYYPRESDFTLSACPNFLF